MNTVSLDLRKRIVAAYDRGEQTQLQVAERFDVSFGLVKKLLAQRRRTGDLAPRHRFSGRKPKFSAEHEQRLRQLVAQHPDFTLTQLREELGVECTLPAIHYVLKRLRLSLKKRPSVRPSSTGPTSSKRASAGRRLSRR